MIGGAPRAPRMLNTVIGKYRIVGSLGRGATGVVYRAVDQTLAREVAIKILSSEAAESDPVKRFRTEATALARLNDPGIATIYELFSSGSDLLMVMEFVSGQTLEQLSDREGPMTPARAACLVDRILSALEHAHRAGVVHRDMKPANVMVHGGGVKIMDFGIARVRGVERITVDECMMGTPAYMAPEHVRGEQVDERADLYAVGVIFYRLLTGKLPFDADSTVGMLQKHISARPTTLRAHRTDLPSWCESIVQRALAKLPAERFQTASEFRAALRRAAGLAPGAFPAEYAAAAQTDDAVVASKSGQTTAVLPRKAAKPIRKSARSASASRSSAFVPSRRATAFGVIGLVASLVLLVQLTTRPPLERRPDRPTALAAPAVLRSPAAVVVAPGEPEPAAAAPAVVARPIKKTQPPMAFTAKSFVRSGRERRMRDVRLVLGDTGLTVTDDATRERLQVVRYDDLSAIMYSHGRDPMWSSSDGPTPIVRTSGRFSRVLGMSVRRHWISLMTRTDGRFLILQVNDAQVGRVLSVLEQRTGESPQLLESRKGAD